LERINSQLNANRYGNSYAQALSIFGAMNPLDLLFLVPPITEIPDYVWYRRYDKPCHIPGKPEKKPEEVGRRISHPNAESALRAAKKACRKQRGRCFGRASGSSDAPVFLVYEDGKVIERHIVGR